MSRWVRGTQWGKSRRIAIIAFSTRTLLARCEWHRWFILTFSLGGLYIFFCWGPFNFLFWIFYLFFLHTCTLAQGQFTSSCRGLWSVLEGRRTFSLQKCLYHKIFSVKYVCIRKYFLFKNVCIRKHFPFKNVCIRKYFLFKNVVFENICYMENIFAWCSMICVLKN